MNKILRLTWELGAFVAAILSVLLIVTQTQANQRFESPVTISPPELVTLKGTFYSPNDKIPTGSHALRIFIHDKEMWVFDIKEARDISGMEPGLSLVDHLFPSKLVFWGSKKLLVSLEKPSLDKKTVTIEGYIHESNNILEVTAIRNVS